MKACSLIEAPPAGAPDAPFAAALLAARAKSRRRMFLVGLLLTSTAVAAACGVSWRLAGRFVELTDDAYVSADKPVVALTAARQSLVAH